MDEIRDWLIRLRLGDPDKRPELRKVRDPAIEETLAALLSWRDKHTAKMVRERLENTDLDWQIGPVTVHYLPLHIIDRLTTDSKEKR